MNRTQTRLNVEVASSLDGFLRWDELWRDLLSRTRTDTIFLDPNWLSAFAISYGYESHVRAVLIRNNDRVVAGGVFRESAGVITLLGDERSDYCEIPIDQDIDDEMAAQALSLILGVAFQSCHVLGDLKIRRLRGESRAAQFLMQQRTRYRSILANSIDAPAMNMSFAPEALRKKSLKRHANGLARAGVVSVDTYTRATEIVPRLDVLFELHIARWGATESPSLFVEDRNRAFYRNFVKALDESGAIRYSCLALDGKPVAVHLGFSRNGIYTWYKPAFDVNLARLSPGEVLLKYVIEQAMEEGVREFDFTIGDEGYKSRFATDVRQVHDFYVCRYRSLGLIRQVRASARKLRGRSSHS